jgi:hypothetical protein
MDISGSVSDLSTNLRFSSFVSVQRASSGGAQTQGVPIKKTIPLQLFRFSASGGNRHD